MPLTKILFVVESAIVDPKIGQQLLDAAYEVVAISVSGEEALDKVAVFQPDLVLLDSQLSEGVNALDVAREICAQRDVPIIYMATEEEEAALLKTSTINPLGILRKPIAPRELNMMIQMTLCHWRMEKRLAASEAIIASRRDLAEALFQSAVSLGSSLDEEVIIKGVLEIIERILPHDGSAVILLDQDHNLLQTYTSGVISNQPNIIALLQQQWPMLKRIYHQKIMNLKIPYMVSQIVDAPVWVKALNLEWVQSVVIAPILAQLRLLGFIVLVNATNNHYDSGNAAPLQAFAAQVAIALENARLYRQTQEHATELERRVAQRTAELDQERGRLQAILDTAGEGIYLTDQAGILLYVNPALEKMTGFSWPELAGRKPDDTWRSGRTPEHTLEELTQAFAHGHAWRGEVVNQRKDGKYFDASLTISPVRSASGRLQGYVCVQRDITHRNELARLKDAFASQIGHELRTPITNIRLYHDLLVRRPENAARYMTVLNQETDRLAKLVEGFIEISLLNADALPIKKVRISLNEVLQALIPGYEKAAQERAIKLSLHLMQTLPSVWVDIYLLNRALHELLENALRYTPMGGWVSAETAVSHDQDQQWVCCTISNSGPGIIAAEQPYLFERFFRGKVTQEYNVPGVGLGLPICHEIIARMGGTITMQSEEGKGAAFTIWLPVAAN